MLRSHCPGAEYHREKHRLQQSTMLDFQQEVVVLGFQLNKNQANFRDTQKNTCTKTCSHSGVTWLCIASGIAEVAVNLPSRHLLLRLGSQQCSDIRHVSEGLD